MRGSVLVLAALLAGQIGVASAEPARVRSQQVPPVAMPMVVRPELPPLAAEPEAPLLQATLQAAVDGRGDHTLVEFEPFYARRGFAPAWTGTPERLAQGRLVLASLAAADQEGLEPASYEVERLGELVDATTPAERVEFDLRLSRALARYAQDVSTGRAGPEHEQDGAIRRASRQPPVLLLETASTTADLAAWLQALPPRSVQYQRLRTALALWRARLGESRTTVPGTRKLEPGMSGPDVVALRRRMIEEGRLAPGPEPLPDRYDGPLEAAVGRFQQDHGLPADGIIGERTLLAINTPLAERVDQLRINMERRRWLPAELGQRHVFVNLADFTLKVVQDDRTIHRARVVVGQPFTSTPMMSEEISYVVLNPYWYVPRSVMVNEMLPQLRRDPGYLARQDLRLFPAAGFDAGQLDPHAIDWAKVSPASWDFKVRQDPGKKNALGVIKFMFPNADNIYLHDTPSRHMFQRNIRAFSHGCIRVQDPLKLAGILLGPQGWPEQRLADAVASGQPNKHITLKQKIPIHLAYITAWVDADGTVQFREDIYGRDRLLAQALRLRTI